jgi:hypothetical protein
MLRRFSGNPTFVSSVLLAALFVFWYFGFFRATGDNDHSKAFTALGALTAGVWTLYQFLLKGTFETSLSMDISVETQVRDGLHVVYLQVTLGNVGGRRITAPPVLTEAQIEDYEASVKYPCDLQLKYLSGEIAQSQYVGWWSNQGRLADVSGVPTHISVLYEYTRSDHAVDFFLEPGEKYVLGHVFVLPAGNYLAKLVFVGERTTAAEYWSRIVAFTVPKQ